MCALTLSSLAVSIILALDGVVADELLIDPCEVVCAVLQVRDGALRHKICLAESELPRQHPPLILNWTDLHATRKSLLDVLELLNAPVALVDSEDKH